MGENNRLSNLERETLTVFSRNTVFTVAELINAHEVLGSMDKLIDWLEKNPKEGFLDAVEFEKNNSEKALLIYENTSLAAFTDVKSDEELRDDFAKAALTGLLAEGYYSSEIEVANMCYDYADELMKARKR